MSDRLMVCRFAFKPSKPFKLLGDNELHAI